ncbi:MAG: hypothetical protein JXA30_16225 [Deltaproteobacteria bacterium]|nr:hypothetical protein [Deltaproteobacteria bacterium]
MIKKGSVILVISWLIIAASCDNGDAKDNSSNAAGSGGDQTKDGGQAGNNGRIPCPSGFQCTAPNGPFVCTEPAGLPPLCVDHRDCDFGPCTQVEGQGYCMQSCGPTPVDQCPEGSVCSALGNGYVCAQSGLLSPPSCNTESCPFGECLLSYNGEKICVLPCQATVVDQCPAGTACAPFGSGIFYCARPATGLADTCSPPNNRCDYGICLNSGETNYCALGCVPPMVETCPAGTACRSIGTYGWICSDKTSALPPVCQSQADCVFGTCIRNGDKSYCTEYCSEPGVDITGMVYGLSGAVQGVEVCVFENNTPNKDLCATTNDLGEFAIFDLPDAFYFILSMTKEGYQSALQLAIPGSLTSALIFTEQEIADAAQAVGVSYPVEGTGSLAFLAFNASGAPVSGFSVSLAPESGSGPYYSDTERALDSSLTSSSSSGWGVFYNLAPGNYALDFSHTSAACEDLSRIMVVIGYLSNVSTSCI